MGKPQTIVSDGPSCTVIARDSIPNTGEMRKEDRRKAAAAVEARKAKVLEVAATAKAAREAKALDEERRAAHDLPRR